LLCGALAFVFGAAVTILGILYQEDLGVGLLVAAGIITGMFSPSLLASYRSAGKFISGAKHFGYALLGVVGLLLASIPFQELLSERPAFDQPPRGDLICIGLPLIFLYVVSYLSGKAAWKTNLRMRLSEEDG
jgi:drug/metabolite transporter (DMT)-like permease